MDKLLVWHPEVLPPARRRRHAVARVLRAGSRTLDALARRLAAVDRPAHAPATDPVLEFYAEAGAPEGALYVDGRLVGVLPGVTRL
jgi:hypothetical protein